MNFHNWYRRVSGNVTYWLRWHFTFSCVPWIVRVSFNGTEQFGMGRDETIRSSISIFWPHQFWVLRMRLNVAQSKRMSRDITEGLSLGFSQRHVVWISRMSRSAKIK